MKYGFLFRIFTLLSHHYHQAKSTGCGGMDESVVKGGKREGSEEW
jgi:hypothetical protein